MREPSLAASEIKLRVGEKHSILLRGLGSAGYAWSYDVSGHRAAVRITGSMVGELPDRPVTSNLDQEFIIVAKQLGHARVQFELRRSWENQSKTPQEVQVIDVAVVE